MKKIAKFFAVMAVALSFSVAAGAQDLAQATELYNAAATAVEDITVQKVDAQKHLKNGQLLIIRNGETYNANGALVK